MASLQTSVATAELPTAALLRKYQHDGAYTDCYFTELKRSISLPDYVEAFYTTWVFKLERWLLTHFVSKPSTDEDAKRVAHAQANTFAAWSVEGRAPDQLLMCDFVSKTRSWFMVTQLPGGSTRLYFGSAVVPTRDKAGKSTLGMTYRVLMGFHKLYSRILLKAASSKLSK
ncbi:hypothetical protein [Steroidobacter sp.]|uniref:hypothetical protein n=1 Tax=Steroidobacter sp. TaxID=1978227 RepID=UPI001A3FA5B2|nr:hypothetical protein [Steroidobacter sp.]MBL8271632.1 hypothetical protein [Steroidobacter sp.]